MPQINTKLYDRSNHKVISIINITTEFRWTLFSIIYQIWHNIIIIPERVSRDVKDW